MNLTSFPLMGFISRSDGPLAVLTTPVMICLGPDEPHSTAYSMGTGSVLPRSGTKALAGPGASLGYSPTRHYFHISL